MLTKLDVINAQLATMGQSPIQEADIATYPLAQTGLLRLRLQSRTFQTRGWWFNTLKNLTLEPGAAPDYVVDFPCGILRVAGPQSVGLSIRGTSLYDHRDHKVRDTPIQGVTAVVELDFTDLPPVAQHHVYNLAVLDFQQDYDSTESTRQRLRESARDTYTEVMAEHIRTVKSNRLHNPGTLASILAIRQGGMYTLPVR